MRIIVGLIFLMQFLGAGYGQISDQIKERVDAEYNDFPDIEHFGAKLNHDFFSKYDKVGAIYYWICKNVDYDTKSHFSKKGGYTYDFRYKTREEKVEKIQEIDNKMALDAFKSKKAEGKVYAHLFKKMCDNAGVECEVISGVLKSKYTDIGKKPGRSNHMWNAVKINDKWHLVDASMGAGFLSELDQVFVKEYSETFFLMEPKAFSLTHYPKRDQWLFCDTTPEEFESLPLLHYRYFRFKVGLTSPLNGIITSLDKDYLTIQFKEKEKINFQDLMGFSYGIEKEDQLAKIVPIKKGNILTLKIPVKDIKYDYLTIFFKAQPLVSYRIKISNNIN
ncbi:transglutaminase domain-containing protein [Plebeiibacterium sediminum]|uniref:Transglutaminase-like domain-containing protein n=1 Tax=Plebeiibacterium sediminum TaxID=2992112 RepID=A0AAE3M258_9BACT|nr:transglutaminase domain-containing protein [Plebeiobacterium sediminum]MCW3785906.1 hypothetical protein [Plebeiobacterium sediminum]